MYSDPVHPQSFAKATRLLLTKIEEDVEQLQKLGYFDEKEREVLEKALYKYQSPPFTSGKSKTDEPFQFVLPSAPRTCRDAFSSTAAQQSCDSDSESSGSCSESLKDVRRFKLQCTAKQIRVTEPSALSPASSDNPSTLISEKQETTTPSQDHAALPDPLGEQRDVEQISQTVSPSERDELSSNPSVSDYDFQVLRHMALTTLERASAVNGPTHALDGIRSKFTTTFRWGQAEVLSNDARQQRALSIERGSSTGDEISQPISVKIDSSEAETNVESHDIRGEQPELEVQEDLRFPQKEESSHLTEEPANDIDGAKQTIDVGGTQLESSPIEVHNAQNVLQTLGRPNSNNSMTGLSPLERRNYFLARLRQYRYFSGIAVHFVSEGKPSSLPGMQILSKIGSSWMAEAKYQPGFLVWAMEPQSAQYDETATSDLIEVKIGQRLRVHNNLTASYFQVFNIDSGQSGVVNLGLIRRRDHPMLVADNRLHGQERNTSQHTAANSEVTKASGNTTGWQKENQDSAPIGGGW